MEPKMKTGARVAMLVAAVALLVPGMGHAHEDLTCGRGGNPISAEITEPEGGKLTVVTDVTGPVAIDAAGDAVVISTTGNVPVTIEYSCIQTLTLTVEKRVPGGDPETIHTETWNDVALNGSDVGPCAQDEVSSSVEIGLDGGEYRFSLSGTGCNGIPLTPSSSGMVVGDPPLGI